METILIKNAVLILIYIVVFFSVAFVAFRDYPAEKSLSFSQYFKKMQIVVIFFLGLLIAVIVFNNTTFDDVVRLKLIAGLLLIASLYYGLHSSYLRIENDLKRSILLDVELEKFLQRLDSITNKINFAKEIQRFLSQTLKIKQYIFYEITDDIQPFKLLWYDEIPFEKIKPIEMYANELYNLIKNKSASLFFHITEASKDLQDVLRATGVEYVVPVFYQNNVMGVILTGKMNLKFSSFNSAKDWHLLSQQIAPRLAIINAFNKEVEVQKMAELGVMASQIAHDFKSFLTLIKLNMNEDELIEKQVNYLSRLVKDISEYARVRTTEKMPADIHQIIDASLDSVSIPDNIHIDRNYGENIPKTLMDPLQIQRVFHNLLENSIRSMQEKGGRIRINTRLIKSIASSDRKWIYIEVMDEGTGIAENDLTKIFEPFYTTHKKKGGTGMGLAIAKQIIQHHSGFIDVTSKIGKGTIFNIRLPVKNN
ncbi:MAG: hypothetical protein Kow00108_02790 [Calditrichia bacterium]